MHSPVLYRTAIGYRARCLEGEEDGIEVELLRRVAPPAVAVTEEEVAPPPAGAMGATVAGVAEAAQERGADVAGGADAGWGEEVDVAAPWALGIHCSSASRD